MTSKLKPFETIEIDLTEDSEIIEFLDAQSKHTKSTYKAYMKRILVCSGLR
jgi:hypothetical protein